MKRRMALVLVPALVALGGCSGGSDEGASNAPSSPSSNSSSSPTSMVTPAGASSFFAHPSTLKADEFTAPNGSTYRVNPDGSFVRTSTSGEGSGSTVNLPTVGDMIYTGKQTVDHEYTLATSQTKPDATGASLTVVENGKSRTVKAVRGVQAGGASFALFVVKPSFDPKNLKTLTRTRPSAQMTSRQ